MDPLAIALAGGVMKRVRELLGIKQLPELDQRLAQMEQIFHSPPLTRALIPYHSLHGSEGYSP
jgi:hypothetical protein